MDEYAVCEDYLDDNAKLESKVIRALARLQKKTVVSGKLAKKAGVSRKQIVKYLKQHFCGLDGDVDSQVMTALVQCIKYGLVCAVNNGKFLLLRPTTKTMISNCSSRIVHGDKCTCAKTVPCPKCCCTVNVDLETNLSSKGRKEKKSKSELQDQETQLPKSCNLCDCCLEIYQMVQETPLKGGDATSLKNTNTTNFDVFSPRDEPPCHKPASKAKKKK